MFVVLYTFLSTQRVTADGAHSQWSFIITRNNGWQREYTAWENFPCVQNTNIFCIWKLVTGVKVFMFSMFHITITITLSSPNTTQPPYPLPPPPPYTPTPNPPNPPCPQPLNLIIGGSCDKYNFCCNKTFVMTSILLSQQACVCLMTNICRDKRFLITSLLLSWQAHVCRNKTCLSLWQKWMSRQNFCHNKHMFVLTNICHDKTFVATNIILSCLNFGCGKHTFVATEDMSQQTRVWHDKKFVMTKMVFAAAPANNTTQHPFPYQMRPKLGLTFDRYAHLACRSEAGDHLSVERKHSSSSNVGHDPQARPISVQVDQTLATCHLFICHSSCTGTFYMPSVTECELEPFCFLDIISHRMWTGTICAV